MSTINDSGGEIGRDFSHLLKSLGKFFKQLVDLQEGIDREGTIYWIKNNKRMRGANAWLLMCSIMIASLGLDLNSPAIIIGAMLISPLMSPILGVGMGIGTNDRETLMISLQHFGVSIAIALVTSYLYFWINPLSHTNATPEIIERTEPTVLAGIVAIFGGIAGIISASRKDQSNAIPGVAIATALMPPLCVAGYGLARSEPGIFSNAFYLFFLNSFFIAVSTFAFIRYMKFPFKTYPNAKESRRTTWLILLVSILITIPSIIILKNVVEKKQREQLVNNFIIENFGDDDDPQSLGYSFTYSDTSRALAIKLLGRKIKSTELRRYEKLLEKAGVSNTRIYAIQGESLDIQEFDRLEKEMTGYKKIVNQLEKTEKEKSEVDDLVLALTRKIDSLQRDTFPITSVNNEITALLDEVEFVNYGLIKGPTQAAQDRHVLFVKWKNRLNTRQRKAVRKKLETYLAGRVQGVTCEIRELD